MKAWIEGPGGFDGRDGRAKNPRTRWEDLSESFTPGRIRFFRKDQAPDTLAAMTADLATDDYYRLGRQLLIDSIPSLWAVANDPSRPFGRYGVGAVVLGEVAVSEEEVTAVEATPPSESPQPLGDDFRTESMHTHMYGDDFPPTNQLGSDL